MCFATIKRFPLSTTTPITANALARKAKKLNNVKLPCIVTLNDINAVAIFRLKNKVLNLNHQIYELDTSMTLANTLARLRTRYLRRMKIHRDETTKYLHYRYRTVT